VARDRARPASRDAHATPAAGRRRLRKTIVAALAALQAIESGKQVAFMAPTEILAEQHYRKLAAWLEGMNVPIAWLSGSVPGEGSGARRSSARERRHRVRGRHPRAVPGRSSRFRSLGLAIVDEQHRFGVAQRPRAARQGCSPERIQLMMSATPIPRTLAMTFYADLDVSGARRDASGRTPVGNAPR
jgi:ATP-dependent DNA helicase RecG